MKRVITGFATSFALSCSIGMFFATTNTWAANIANGEALVQKSQCVACHGAGLNAPISAEYPKLAGQYADYIYNALRAYQVEGNPIFGRSNPIMKGQVTQNPAITDKNGKPRAFTEQELRDIAAYIQSLPGSLVTRR